MDNLGAVYFWHSHALISDATKNGLLAQCNFSTVGPLKVQIDSSGKVGRLFASQPVCVPRTYTTTGRSLLRCAPGSLHEGSCGVICTLKTQDAVPIVC